MRMLIEGFERPVLIHWEHVMNEAEYVKLCADNPDLHTSAPRKGTSSSGAVQQRARR